MIRIGATNVVGQVRNPQIGNYPTIKFRLFEHFSSKKEFIFQCDIQEIELRMGVTRSKVIGQRSKVLKC